MDEKTFAASLNALSFFGPRYLPRLKERFGSFKNAWAAPARRWREIKDFSPEDLRAAENEKLANSPEKIAKELKENNISLLSRNELPPLLLETPVPPELLYIKGALPSAAHWLGMVGTRRPSSYGKECARSLVHGLSGQSFVIISGLARGIDSCAHSSALDAKLPTLAVLGCGLSPKVLFPKENIPLAEKIIKEGGAVISEYAFNWPSAPWQFPERNRIVAGLSHGVLVIEAREKSGALITANFALEYNRDVLAVPGSMFNENSKGPNRLLKRGAVPVTTSLDILDTFGIEYENSAETDAASDFSDIERKILDHLSSPLTRDELIRQSGLEVKDAISALMFLEMRGIIKENGSIIVKTRST